MENCLIVGARTYGQVYAKYLAESFTVLGFLDDNPELLGQKIAEHEVLGPIDDLFETNRFPNDITSVFVPIGDNMLRCSLLERIRLSGYLTPSFIHHSVMMDSSVLIEHPVYMLPGTKIMPFTKLGRDVMISMGVNVAHHVEVKRGCFFSQGSNIGASIIIEDLAYVGIGATLMTGVRRIGRDSLVGAGAVVVRDVPDHAVVAGVPAKVLKMKNTSRSQH